MTIKKIYCFVDESGQDTEGEIFIVSVVVTSEQKDKLLQLCERIEKESGKGKFKWGKAQHKLRLKYLQRIFTNKLFKGILRYSTFHDTKDYDSATIKGIAKAVQYKEPKYKYTTLIYVDGLSKVKRHEYGSRLRRLGISTDKVQGVTKDENNSLTRLADAIAGFVRDVLDREDADAQKLFREATRAGVLIKVKA